MTPADQVPRSAGAPLLTAADLAERLGVPVSTVMTWNRQFSWPHVRVGRTYRWTPEQLDEIVRLHTVETQGGVEPRLPGQIPGQTRLSALRHQRR